MSEWADEEAGLEAVQKVVDSLDDIYALQNPLVEQDVMRDILRDDRLHMLLQVRGRYGIMLKEYDEDDDEEGKESFWDNCIGP